MGRIHDVGGMYGFGPVPEDDALFHEDWERTVFGTVILLGTQGRASVHEARHAVERLPPVRYLENSYFERWLDARLIMLREAGVIDDDDLASLVDRAGDDPDDDALDPEIRREHREAVRDRLRADTDTTRPADDAAFAEGDTVRVRGDHPEGHTRCPGYARRARGTVHAVRGTQPFPDADVAGAERREPLYTVQFDAKELWGEAGHEGDAVSIDLWEPYLDPVDDTGNL